MAPRDAHLAYLAAIPLFSSCSVKELKTIERAADEVAVDAGRVIIEEGSYGREAYVVTDGWATVKRGNRKINALGPGDHFGELALFDGGPRTATVTADTPMTLLVMRHGDFAGLLEAVPALNRKVLANLASKIRELDRKIYA